MPPLLPSEAPAPPPAAGPASGPPAPVTVVVVDDAPADCDLYCLLLQSWGFQAVATDDGWAGLVCARTLLPALVVTDVRMPHLDGWGLLARLRAGAGTAGIPVLFVTGDPEAVPLARARAAGAAGVLAKPLDFALFQATATRLLAEAGGGGLGDRGDPGAAPPGRPAR